MLFSFVDNFVWLRRWEINLLTHCPPPCAISLIASFFHVLVGTSMFDHSVSDTTWSVRACHSGCTVHKQRGLQCAYCSWAVNVTLRMLIAHRWLGLHRRLCLSGTIRKRTGSVTLVFVRDQVTYYEGLNALSCIMQSAFSCFYNLHLSFTWVTINVFALPSQLFLPEILSHLV